MSEWNVIESYSLESMEEEGYSKESLQGKWEEVADDMALIPDRNVRVTELNGVVRVEVSQELLECMRGM